MTQEDQFYGWTYDQWAIALARYPVESDDIQDFLKVRKEWQKNYSTTPGEIKFENVIIPKDFKAAGKLIDMVIGV